MTDIATLRRAVEEGMVVWGVAWTGQPSITADDLRITDPSDPVTRKETVPVGILVCWEFRWQIGWGWTCYDLTHLNAMGEGEEIYQFPGSLDDPQHAVEQCKAENAQMDQRLRQWRSDELEVGQIVAAIPTADEDLVSVFFSHYLDTIEGKVVSGTPEEVGALVGAHLTTRLTDLIRMFAAL